MNQSYSFFAFLFINLLLLSCSTSDDPVNPGTDGNPAPIAATEVKTMEIVSIEVDGGVSQTQYTGTISGQEVTVVRVDKNNVMFMVPASIDEGHTALTVPALELEMPYAISRASLSKAPEEVFTSLYETATTEIAVFDDTPEAKYIAEYWVQLKESFDNATEAEKEAAALYYSVNQTMFDNLITDDHSRTQNSDYSILLKHKVATLAFGAGVAVAILGPTPLDKALGAGIALIGWKKSKDYLAHLVQQKLRKVNFVIGDLESDLNRSQSTLSFTHNKEKTFNLTVQQREINTSDADSSNENLEIFFSGYYLFNETVEKLNEIINFINENLFAANMDEVFRQNLTEASPVKTSVTSDIYQNLNWTLAGDEVEIKEINFEEEFTLTLAFTDAENLEEDHVDTDLQYSYSDTFNDFTGSFPVRVKKPVIKVVTLSGASLPSPLELINNAPTGLKLVDEDGNDIEDFDVSKLVVSNISNNTVKIHVQQNGAFNGNSGGEYFEIIPLTDEEEAEVSFDLVYEGNKLNSINAVVKQRGNGFMMDGEFYALEKGFVEVYGSSNRWNHEVVLTSSNITHNDSGFFGEGENQGISFVLVSNKAEIISDGTYTYNLNDEQPFIFDWGMIGFNLNGYILHNGIWESTYSVKGGTIEVQNFSPNISIEFEFILENNNKITGSYQGTIQNVELD